MDNLIRLLVGIVFFVVLVLGFKMAIKKAGRGKITDRKGLTRMRTILVACIAPMIVLFLVSPQDTPVTLKISLPDWMKLIGLVFFIAGMSLRMWSQVVLGTYWSADLSLKTEHKLIQGGPYKYVRHPIYSSYILVAPSLFLLTENWMLGLLAIIFVLVSIARIPAEENMLKKHFGDLYSKYIITTGAVFPRFC